MAKLAIRDKFAFEEHPWCCFCGGTKPTTTRDHVPPQSMFLDRHTPAGFLFPACAACNQGSSKFDRLFALVSFLSVREPTAGEVAARVRLEAEIKRDHPEIYNAIERVSLAGVVPGAFGLRLPDDMVKSIDVIARKLACALHYHFTRRILPEDWHNYVRIAHWPSHMPMRLADPEFEWLFKEQASLQRSTLDLSDQFSCRYTVDSDGSRGAYLCAIRSSHQIAILVRL